MTDTTAGLPTAESWAAQFADRSLATSFDLRAADYARLRPGYPGEAIDTAVPANATRVLDLGAGTGKLTESLLNKGFDVIAVEPLWGMLAELHLMFPRAVAVVGSAEHIPLARGVVDAVTVGQAFHWFDPEAALTEIARVLRPGGSLALLWNHDDEADPLVNEIELALNRAGRRAGGSTGRGTKSEDTGTRGSATPPFHGHPAFTDPVLTEVEWHREQHVGDLIGLLNTYSYVIRASDATRATLDAEVRNIVRERCAGSPRVRLPVICQVWRSTCR